MIDLLKHEAVIRCKLYLITKQNNCPEKEIITKYWTLRNQQQLTKSKRLIARKPFNSIPIKIRVIRNGRKFKEAAEAYEVLSDPQKRQRYDQFGHAGVGSSAAAEADLEAE